MKNKTVKSVLKCILYFVCYLILAYAVMLPGYKSPVYWMLFPIAAAFLMAGPLTCTMNLLRKPGSALLFPVIFFLLARVSGEMKFTVCWVPFLAAVLLAEVLHIVIGTDKVLSIRVSVPVAMLSMAMWNNGFYFGGEAYKAAAVADMGEAYIASAYQMSTPVTYIAVVVGVILAAIISERLSEKIAKVK